MKPARVMAGLTGFGLISACTGGSISDMMPGTDVIVDGVPFTVTDTARGLTVRNFETGRTAPAQLLILAGIAAERATGCPLTSITKEPGVNTYYAAVSCPAR